MMRRYVIAGTRQEYNDYLRKRYLDQVQYVYVYDVYVLKGLINPHGVFIGTWIKHPQIQQILQQINVSTNELNPNLIKAIQLYNKHITNQ